MKRIALALSLALDSAGVGMGCRHTRPELAFL